VRVQSPDRQGISGTGPGLSICREIVRAHHGEIRAESEGPGQGYRFHFTLPVAEPTMAT
jgi:signal transduction histidine kinase